MTTAALLHRQIVPGGEKLLGEWPMKTYTITAERPAAGAGGTWGADAMELAADVMAKQPRDGDAPAAGFVILHHGEVGNWLLIDWWRGDILHQELFLGMDPDLGFAPPPPHVIACSFELVVTDHERRSWAKHVLCARPDVPAYLADSIAVAAGDPYS